MAPAQAPSTCAAEVEAITRSLGSGHAGDPGPGLKGLRSGGSVLIGGDVIATEMKEMVDPVVSSEETLRPAG